MWIAISSFNIWSLRLLFSFYDKKYSFISVFCLWRNFSCPTVANIHFTLAAAVLFVLYNRTYSLCSRKHSPQFKEHAFVNLISSTLFVWESNSFFCLMTKTTYFFEPVALFVSVACLVWNFSQHDNMAWNSWSISGLFYWGNTNF